MKFRNLLRGLLSAVLFAFLIGCGRSHNDRTAIGSVVFKPSPDTVAHVHWLGRKYLDLDADGYYVSRIWSQSETKRLQSQTLDKLAVNLWPILLPNAHREIPGAVLRPLLDDVVLEESWLEMRSRTNSSAMEACFAIHLPSARAGVWITNLAIAAEFLTGGTALPDPAQQGWSIQQGNRGDQIRLARVGDWTLISVGPIYSPMRTEIAASINQARPEASARATNAWLDVELDVPRTAQALSLPWKLPETLSRLKMKFSGDGAHVIADGGAMFSSPISGLEAWRTPTNLIHEPLLGFTAVRGIRPWLAKWKAWNDWQIGAPPNQLFFWSLAGTPFQTYAAAPSDDAHQQVSTITDLLLQKGNPWLATNGYISFAQAPDSDGVVWGNMTAIRPFLKSTGTGKDGWLYAGLLGDSGAGTNAPLSKEILQDLAQQTNLVYYDRELTGNWLPSCLTLSQTARQVARQPELPMDCASLDWLGILIPRLGPSLTTIQQTAPNELSLHRISTSGFTAPEMHLVATWLESPSFPRIP